MNKEWLKQLELANEQLVTLAHIKKLAEDEMMMLYEEWQEYQRKYKGKDFNCLYWIKSSSVEPYEGSTSSKWWVWVHTDMWPMPLGFVDKCLFLVEFTPDGWIAQECPAIG